MKCYDSGRKGFMWRGFAAVLLLVVAISRVTLAQDFTVRPIRHSLPDGLQSVSGSSSDGGCTSRNGSICNLQDGGTSVLFDNTIPPLSGLEGGQWARDLFTVRRSGTDGIVIGFEFANSVIVRRVELVLFNCPLQSIRVPQFLIYGTFSTDPFPLSDPTSGNSLVVSRPVSPATINSCEDLYRICVQATSGGQFPVYYIVIPNAIESDWVYLAEVIFHIGAGVACDADALVTEPVTPPPSTTSEEEATTTDTDSTAEPETTAAQGGTTESAGRNPTPTIVAVVVVLLILIIIAAIAVILIVMFIMMKKRKRKQYEVQKFQSAMLETKDLTLSGAKPTNETGDVGGGGYYDTVDVPQQKSRSPESEQGSRYEDIDSHLKNGRRAPKPKDQNTDAYNVLRETEKKKTKSLPASTSDRPEAYSTLNREQPPSDVYAVPGGAVYAEPHLQEEYSEIQKPAAPAIPQKSDELVQYLETKPITESTTEQPEYSEIGNGDGNGKPKTNTLTKISSSFLGIMESNPTYMSATAQPTGATNTSSAVPQPTTDNIYAEPGEASENPDDWQNIYETVYSEPIKPSLFTEGATADEAVNKDEELFPYSSIYTAPVLPAEEEKPLTVRSENIKEIKELGRGNFGQVVLAQTIGLSRKELRLSTSEDGSKVSIYVAVKKLKASASSKTRELFDKECRFMSRLNHPNVIRLLGICTEGTPFIMMEYMENGDLNQYLQKFDSVSDDPYQNANGISPSTLVHMATQIAGAMQYLASQNFVHRDLATRNCLVGQDSIVKIADFGMSRSLYDSHYYMIQGKVILPIRWMATECFYGKFSAKTDVWAFGVTMWEIFTLAKEEPYSAMPDSEMVEDAVRGESRTLLDRPAACPREVYNVMKMCWFFNPADRATFDDLHSMLSSISPS